ncbi:smoothelin isoform X2 [Spea bombifrons]|uniref:smoothelin isoform X2 n=1 Tax=Spea bombifrons TaxID=233779 RepID=UPI00234B8DB8|nr:smoothelin isoform X2 [Spea bombifrons]
MFAERGERKRCVAAANRDTGGTELVHRVMSGERFSAMDESSLRKLLEVTLDLTERREIRSAIRELRRKELERCEEALASKRFRSERSNEQENKENQPGARQEEKQQRALHALAGRLEDMSDIDELTVLLRAASEYEERKLIRAAIRKVRNDEIEAASHAGALVSRSKDRDNGAVLPRGMESNGDHTPSLVQEKEDLEERQRIKAQIHGLLSAQNGDNQSSRVKELPSEMLMNLGDPRERQPSFSSSSSTSSEPVNLSDIAEGSSISTDVALETKSLNGGTTPCPEPAAGKHKSEDIKPSSLRARDALSQISVVDKKLPAGLVDRVANNAIHRLESDNKQSLPVEKAAGACTEQDFKVPLSPFRRANSVRDRVKKFTEEPPGVQPVLGHRFGSMRGERAPFRGGHVQQQQTLLSGSQQNGQSIQKVTQEDKVIVKPRLNRTVLGPNGYRADHSTEENKTQGFKIIPELKSSRSVSIKGSSSASSTGLCTSGEASKRFPQSQGSITKKDSGRDHVDQLLIPQSTTEGERQVENRDGTIGTSEFQGRSHHSTTPLCTSATGTQSDKQDTDMKTLLTIEIKDGRNQTTSSRIVGQPGNQRAELTLGLTASPFRIGSGVSTSSGISTYSSTGASTISVDSGINTSTSSKVETDLPQQPSQQLEVFLPSTTEKVETEIKKKLTAEELSSIEEEEILDKMLDNTTDYEERRMIRTAMRELRQRKRDQREKEREQRFQELKNKERESRLARNTETSMRQSETTNHGSAVSKITKTQRLVQSNDGSKTSRTTTVEASYMKRSENGGTIVQTKSSFSSTSKKVGSIFDREDDGQSRANSVTAMERLQAERKKELMKAQSLPKTPATQSRKAMIEKLEKESGSSSSPAFAKVATPRSSAFGVPNANSIKQMLLDWCKAKTRGYEHVNIQNFSSSWSDGMAFCALVHNFFPDAFDYSQLIPQNRRQNFDLAFSAAEKHADCPQLLDAEDMVRMREPDWKCVYTYIQEFYRCLVQKGMVKTKKS